VVCEHDDFQVLEDDGNGKTIVHHGWGMGPRGSVIGFYARAKKRNGDIDYEFMTSEQVEEVRQQYSRAKDSAAWTKSWEEMGKKTVIKRLSKRLPLSSEVKAAMNGDDDAPEFEKVRVAPVSRPIFESPKPKSIPRDVTPPTQPVTKPELTRDPEPDEPEPEPGPEPEPEPEPEVSPHPTHTGDAKQKGPAEMNYLKGIRGLLRSIKPPIKESELLDFLAEQGSTDGSVGSLEELQLQFPNVVQLVFDQWSEVAARIQGA